MPRKYETSRKKRNSRARKRRTRRTRTLGLAPKSKLVRLRYVQEFTINPAAAGAASTYVFSTSSLFDPNYTAGGHQPRQFDQCMDLYNHYTVIGSKIKVRQGNPTSSNISPASYWGIAVQAHPTSLDNKGLDDILENRTTSRTARYGGSYNHIKSMSAYYNAKRFHGATSIVGKDLYRGSAGSSPSENAYFVVWATGINNNDAGPLSFLAEIEYIAVLTESKYIVQS